MININQESLSDYDYCFRSVKSQQFLMIEDLNKGRRSVTNNIENIVDYICSKHGVNPVEHYIIYKDSDGTASILTSTE